MSIITCIFFPIRARVVAMAQALSFWEEAFPQQWDRYGLRWWSWVSYRILLSRSFFETLVDFFDINKRLSLPWIKIFWFWLWRWRWLLFLDEILFVFSCWACKSVTRWTVNARRGGSSPRVRTASSPRQEHYIRPKRGQFHRLYTWLQGDMSSSKHPFWKFYSQLLT